MNFGRTEWIFAGPIPGMSRASSMVRGFFAARCSRVLLVRTMNKRAFFMPRAISARSFFSAS